MGRNAGAGRLTLSSSDAEGQTAGNVAAEVLSCQSLLADLGWHMNIRVCLDAHTEKWSVVTFFDLFVVRVLDLLRVTVGDQEGFEDLFLKFVSFFAEKKTVLWPRSGDMVFVI